MNPFQSRPKQARHLPTKRIFSWPNSSIEPSRTNPAVKLHIHARVQNVNLHLSQCGRLATNRPPTLPNPPSRWIWLPATPRGKLVRRIRIGFEEAAHCHICVPVIIGPLHPFATYNAWRRCPPRLNFSELMRGKDSRQRALRTVTKYGHSTGC